MAFHHCDLVSFGSSSSLQGNFSYCKTDILDPINQLQNLCEQNLNPIQIKDQKLYTILTRGKYHTYGNWFKCVVNKVTVTTRKGFFGYLYSWRNIVPLILNRYECQLLVANNNCYGNNMTGDTGYWKFNDEPMVEYYWLQSLNFEVVQCDIHKVTILGSQLNEKLFKDAKSSCVPENLYCIVDKSTYI